MPFTSVNNNVEKIENEPAPKQESNVLILPAIQEIKMAPIQIWAPVRLMVQAVLSRVMLVQMGIKKRIYVRVGISML